MASSASSALPTDLASAFPGHLRRHIRSGRELTRRSLEESQAARSTGLQSLDRLLRGGTRAGQLTEIIGERSSGRFSVVLALLAAATASGEAVALIDLGDALDPQNATTSGIDLERLLWVRPTRLKTALHATESIVGAGFPIVAIDLGVPPVPGGRGSESSWVRLARTIAEHRTTLIVTTPYRVSGSAASTVLRIADRASSWSGRGRAPRLLEQVRASIEIEKARSLSTEAVMGPGEQLEFRTA